MSEPTPGPATEATPELPPGATNVAFVVRHVVKPGAQARYEAWLLDIMAKAATYPGHQGVHVLRPAEGGRAYTIVLRFATLEQAAAWAGSADRKARVAAIAADREEGDQVEIQPGIEFWFTPPPGPPRKARPWKQWLVTTSVIWPLTMLVPAAFKPVFHAVPPLATYGLSHLLVASTIVAIVTWIVMPRYVQLVHRWLFA